ncbi:MAG: adenylyltransferase/cytidyltransferase family protein [Alphaproteobacteria bacterium]|nr:adenylyltransferase/cytidyltransferase family protein [Alphaproteobacteria bacterium]
MPSTQTRIMPVTKLLPLIEKAKESGKIIVTTNGVYDFIHAGHLEYLEEARDLGDMLIVILNTDDSVRRIKGPQRPINNEQDRALVVAGLRCVDYVTFFDEDTPSEILAKIKPTIHTKGGDYDPEKMPETKIIRENGGDVKILALKPGYSNSKQYERILEAAKIEGHFERPEWLQNAQIEK